MHLLDYTARKLLEKFGQGSHKPGSGSAVAFEGMLAAELVHTVISITNEDKHRVKYAEHLADLLRKDTDILQRILPSLEDLFQRDAILFDKVIQLRRKRDEETDTTKRIELEKLALDALKPATQILLEIGDLCADVADYAAQTFDNGFKSARGDSGVALNNAVGALAGCLAIIDLNLSYFGSDDWTIKGREQLETLRVDYRKLAVEAKNRMEDFSKTSLKKSFNLAKTELSSGRWEGINLSDTAIEALANQATNLLWDFRDLLWNGQPPSKAYEILKPEVILEKILEYRYGYVPAEMYEEGGVAFQVAGTINKKEKIVGVATGMSPEVQAFTAAHELGHAFLHTDLGIMHRDRPLDGAVSTVDIKERQANKFAACFLMPARIVEAVFQQVFDMNKFEVNDNTMFKLRLGGMSDFRRKFRTVRSISTFIARYKGNTYQPLHKIFGVSVTAMAIRLEELGLIEI